MDERVPSDLLNLLVIDDDAGIRELMQQTLLRAGHQVFAVESAEEGLELLPLFTFHVAFLDQNLPGMEGLVLGEYLRKNNPHMEIALVTGDDDRRVWRAVNQHQLTLIRKPFELRQILDVIDLYRQKEQSREQAQTQASRPDFAPVFAPYLDQVSERVGAPSVPERLIERLLHAVRASLTHLRSERRYEESHRITALAALLTLRVLGVAAPRGTTGQTLYEEYDELMRRHGRRVEFDQHS